MSGSPLYFLSTLVRAYAERGHNWATLLLQDELSPDGIISTLIDMKVLPTAIEFAALRGSLTPKGTRALGSILEAIKDHSMDAGIGHLAKLCSATYKQQKGTFAHF